MIHSCRENATAKVFWWLWGRGGGVKGLRPLSQSLTIQRLPHISLSFEKARRFRQHSATFCSSHAEANGFEFKKDED